MRKSYIILSVIAIFAVLFYFTFPAPHMKGSAHHWKVTYTKNNAQTDGIRGWTLSIKQKDQQQVHVKEIAFLDDQQIVAHQTQFSDYKDIDGTVYTLHPFSYPDLYIGDAPKKGHTYTVKIKWIDTEGDLHKETIHLK